MNKKQYNNLIRNTLKHENTDDSLSIARDIFNNMGVALPQGDIRNVYKTIKSNDYMGWRSCTMQEAQEAADQGVAAIGISENRIVVIPANDEEQHITNTTLVRMSDKNTSDYTINDLKYYLYSCEKEVNYYNTEYKDLLLLTDTQLNQLDNNKSFYQSVVNGYGIPWETFDTINYRETKLKREYPNNCDESY